MDVEQKIWGTVRHLFYGPVCASLLSVKAGAYCSIHRHQKRWNHFLVTHGIIDVVLYRIDPTGLVHPTNRVQLVGNKHIDRTGYAVPPGVLHRFEVVQSGWVVESYWTDDGSEAQFIDIERLQPGGRF